MTNLHKRLALTALCVASILGITQPALATPLELNDSSKISESDFRSNLNARDREIWDSHSPSERQDALAAMSDPRFSNASELDTLNAEYPRADVAVITTGNPASSPAQALVAPNVRTGSRTSYVKDSFKVIGITVASVTTNARYSYSGTRVTHVSYCSGDYRNLIPGRQLSSFNYHSISNGSLTCKVDWKMTTAWGTGSRSATQGFRVNGSGKFLKQWHV